MLCGDIPPPRRAVLRALRDKDRELLDRGLVLWFPGPASYTGEDTAELQVHGGPAVLSGIADALVEAGARPAEPGEFTRRAFLNGKLDLLEAEGVADLVAAETTSQRRMALQQLGGAQSALIGDWSMRLTQLLAWQEALIDFPDEDLPPEVEQQLTDGIEALRLEFDRSLSSVVAGARVRNGLVFAVTGAPNVGKSSIVNALAEREVAIISPNPGTTRDALEVRLEFAGVPVTLVDTAGLRDTEDPVEQEGVRRARSRAEAADLVITVLEPGSKLEEPANANGLAVFNKIDLRRPDTGCLAISTRTGEGMRNLREALSAQVVQLAPTLGFPAFSRARHSAALQEASSALDEARLAAMPELRGEALRLAMRALSRITGRVDTESLLDMIFGQFCIGK